MAETKHLDSPAATPTKKTGAGPAKPKTEIKPIPRPVGTHSDDHPTIAKTKEKVIQTTKGSPAIHQVKGCHFAPISKKALEELIRAEETEAAFLRVLHKVEEEHRAIRERCKIR